MLTNEARRQLSYLIPGMAVLFSCHLLDADWVIDNPPKDQSFCLDNDIDGNGTGPANTGFTAYIQIGGNLEGGDPSATSPEENWEASPNPPTSGWTASTNAYYEIWKNDEKQVGKRIVTTDCGGGA